MQCKFSAKISNFQIEVLRVYDFLVTSNVNITSLHASPKRYNPNVKDRNERNKNS